MNADAAAEQILEKGWVLLENVIPSSRVTRLAGLVDELMEGERVPFGENEFLGTRTRRMFNLLARHQAFQEVPTETQVLPVAQAVLDRECLLSSLTAIEMNPGETLQPLHADDGSIALPKPHPALTCTAIWALTDFTMENGATRLVPGSHRSPRSPRRDDAPEVELAEMSAGSVLVYHGSLWHGGGANQSDEARVGIVANYCAGFLRQEECQLLALEREHVAGFSPELQRLVGYSTYRGLMGHVDQQDPAEWVDPEAKTDMVWKRIRG